MRKLAGRLGFAIMTAGAVGLGAVPLAAQAPAPPAAQAEDDGEFTPENLPPFLKARVDQNGDGAVSPQEWQQAQQILLSRFDANSNGRLDPEERAQIRQLGRPMRRPGANPLNPDNLPPQVRERLLERFDANKNGQLEPDELQRARAALGNMRPGGDSGLTMRPGTAAPPVLDQSEVLAKYDANGNGQLDLNERLRAIADLRASSE